MKTFKCRCGADITVDDGFESLVSSRWRCAGGGSGMVLCTIGKATIYLVHQVMPFPAPKGFVWDHKDRNPHNNLRDNLRIATRSQNMANSTKRVGTSSKYKGVAFDVTIGRWRARFGPNREYLGTFDNEEEAAVAYNTTAIERFGEFACLNVLPWPNSVFQGPPKQSDIPLPMMQITA